MIKPTKVGFISIMMITSKTNGLVKYVRSLADKKNRDKDNVFLIESVKLIKEAVLLNKKIKVIIATEKGAKLFEEGVDKNLVQIVSDDVFKTISTEVSPQGAIAVLEKPSLKLKEVYGKSLILENVSDPSNMGAIIRSAGACGITEIFVSNGSTDPFSPKAVRASMGGIFRVNIYFGDILDIISCVKAPILVADMDGVDIFEDDFRYETYSIALGNEGNGVSETLLKNATKTYKIPMENNVESLNVAVSAGIIMYTLKNKK